MTEPNDAAFLKVFLEHRTHNAFADRPVDDATLKQIYEVAKMGPTSANSSPMRILFAKSKAAKEKLRPVLSPGNLDKTMSAPVTAIIAYDLEFHAKMGKLFPHFPPMQGMLAGLTGEARDFYLLQNASLGAAYFILAARALGVDTGPMAGFDRGKTDDAFFAGTTWRSILLVNLGYGSGEKLMPRSPRLDFEEACKIE